MRYSIAIASVFFSQLVHAQTKHVAGVFKDGAPMGNLLVTFNADSTFEYAASEHPVFYSDHFGERFSEKGRWTLVGDTIILNPQLGKKAFVETELLEQDNPADTGLTLTFNHINRYFDQQGNILKTDTSQVRQLDYAFNDFRKRHRRRVSAHRSSRCTFAGYIPKETITNDRTVVVEKPGEALKQIYFGCYEQQGTKAFPVKDQASTRLTFNVYSNYYQDGLLRQVKFLMQDDNTILIRQKANGKFKKSNIWIARPEAMLKRQKETPRV